MKIFILRMIDTNILYFNVRSKGTLFRKSMAKPGDPRPWHKIEESTATDVVDNPMGSDREFPPVGFKSTKTQYTGCEKKPHKCDEIIEIGHCHYYITENQKRSGKG